MRLAHTDRDEGVLWDTATTRIRLLSLAAADVVDARGETTVCVAGGSIAVEVDGAVPVDLGHQEGLHLPAEGGARIVAGSKGARILEVLSRHPSLDPARRLMPPLEAVDRFDLHEDRRFRYTDHIRGGVIAFPPGGGAEKHYHEGAEELFWFLDGTARLVTPDGETTCRPGNVTILASREWHILDNLEPERPLRLFFTVSPNLVPSHTYFAADGSPLIRSMAPLTKA